MIKQQVVNNQLIYISATTVNDMQNLPVALFVSPDLTTAKKVVFAETTAIPRDILIRGDKTYVLTNVKKSNSLYTNIVYESVDLKTWKETLKFSSDTFARSFEELNGDFYFGLGSDVESVSASTGKILKVKKSSYSK
jgi:sucrose-6-phosphate hydrolase SacC (GH32 family)